MESLVAKYNWVSKIACSPNTLEAALLKIKQKHHKYKQTLQQLDFSIK